MARPVRRRVDRADNRSPIARSLAPAVVLAAIALLAMLAVAAWFGLARDGKGDARAAATAPLLLFTSLPIYWAEAPDIATTLNGTAQQHWARRAIEATRVLRPIDTLDMATLGGRPNLLMIQPRPLSPDENVALDAWVAGGGRLLLFADPALTSESTFALGDRRRPHDIVLLSPILARWGLRLEFDEDQAAGERAEELGEGAAVPVNLPGRFVVVSGGRPDSACRLGAQALVAECRVGRGKVIAIADAALFEGSDDAPRRAALDALLARTF